MKAESRFCSAWTLSEYSKFMRMSAFHLGSRSALVNILDLAEFFNRKALPGFAKRIAVLTTGPAGIYPGRQPWWRSQPHVTKSFIFRMDPERRSNPPSRAGDRRIRRERRPFSRFGG